MTNLENNCENLVKECIVEDGEIYDIVELDGIEVWGQHQNVLEQQALSHLKSLTEDNTKNTEGNNAVIENVNNQDKPLNKRNVQSSVLDINKYLQSQAQLKTNFEHKKNKLISSKSKDVAKKVSDTHLYKNNSSRNNSSRKRQKIKNDVIDNIQKNSVKEEKEKTNPESDSEYYPSEDCESDDDYYLHKTTTSTKKPESKRKRVSSENFNETDEKVKDDGSLACYMNRMQEYCKNKDNLNTEEFLIEGNLKITKIVWDKLYSYQQDGVKWLWNIHKQAIGGLLGDEMGLGKTVQVIVFLCALEYSKISSCNGRYTGLGPSIVVSPATVIHQWIKHFHQWWPPFRVAILHQSGTYHGNRIKLINDIHQNNGILVTTYESILKYTGLLAEKKWHYLILDEGHKIRNPSAKMTIAVKQFRTPHKLILTGSPMQNNLQELWSLFDFLVPGKLGSHQAFMEYFATPIIQGGYANATLTQETTAQLIATSLKDMISPFMLRRTKEEVKDIIYLPSKSEQVLFCSLTDEQKDLYRGYLLSDHIGSIIGRTSTFRPAGNHTRTNILVGITTLRKICNHPDLYLGEADEADNFNSKENIPEEKTFGYFKRSGKMIVVAALLKIWKRQGHRMLLFTQTRGMVDIFEDFLMQQEYKYLKMDGNTSISIRQFLINKFNQDNSYDVFLLTTRVGGLGVNLIGANRVIIYDPDWNPATDTQARERAWRIGQNRQVTIYRLVSAGTIEEKMYQRQVWKQLLSNKILIDPKTKRFFKSSDLCELFSFQEHTDTNPETANIFKNSKVEINSTQKSINDSISEDENVDVQFSEEKVEEMKKKAQEIAKMMSTSQKINELEKTESEEVNRPSPAELRAINRKKLEKIEEPIVNKIDDCQTNTSFSEALVIVDKQAANCKKKVTQQPVEGKTVKLEKQDKEKVKIDKSGEIDGEKIEGLLKREVKKKEKSNKNTNQDDYVLEKLFSKKNVHTALQHDIIVQSGYKESNNLKIHYEAKKKADMALNALRKSRLSNWRW